MSSLSTPVRTSSDDEIVTKSLLVTPPRFMPISANRTTETELPEQFNSLEDELELVEEKSEHSEAKTQPAATLHIPTKIGDEVTALRLQLGQDEQRIVELEQQMAIMKDAKRKWEENPGGSSGQQRGKRQKTVNGCTAGQSVKKRYKGKQPLCTRCNRHHTGQCGPQCGKCGRFGHLTRNCRVKAPVNNQVVRSANKQENPKACYECGGVGHLKARCGNSKNQNKNKNNSTRGTDK